MSLWKVAVLETKHKKSMSKLLVGKKENFAEKWCLINETCYEKSKAQRHIMFHLTTLKVSASKSKVNQSN